VAGFTGLVKRTQKNHAAALPLLRQGLALVAKAEAPSVLGAEDDEAPVCANQVRNCGGIGDQNAADSKSWRQKLWDRKSAGKEGSRSEDGDVHGGSSGNSSSSSSQLLWMHRGLAGDAGDRW